MALISIDGSIERTSKIFFLDSRVRAAQQQRMRILYNTTENISHIGQSFNINADSELPV
jgi:hypothetical protein